MTFWEKIKNTFRRDKELQLVSIDQKHPTFNSAESFRANSGISTSGNIYGNVWNEGSKSEYGISATGSGNIYDHALLLQNARTAYFESVQARSLVDRFADTVVDTGLRLEPTPKADILGITIEQAEKWSDNVAQLFDCWFGSKKCMRDELMTGYQFQRLIEIATQRDGEYFVRMHYSPQSNLINSLQLSLIDPTQIQGSGFTDTYGFNRSYSDGIVRDLSGKETAYSVMALTAKGYRIQRIPAFGPRSGRRFMLHGFQVEYPGQGRGISRLAHTLQEFSNITDFSEAQILKAIAQSQLNLSVEPSKDAPASNPFENQAGFQAGLTNFYGGSTTQVIETGGELPHVIYSELPEITARKPGAVGVFGLQSGEKIKPFENSAPVESFAQFVEAFTTHLAAAHSIPIEVLTMKFSRSYTASMGALILFWRVAEIWRAEMAADLLNPIYEAWLSEEIAIGRIRASGWSDPLMRQAWLSSKWGGAPMPIIDPAKQSKADKEFAELGAHHLDDIARNHNGSDGKLNRIKLQRQYEELPVAPWSKKDKNFGGE